MTTDTGNWVGQTLAGGRYALTVKLGEGGMGFVYRARDNGERDVVVKVPRQAILDDPDFAGRFTREVRALQKLEHPHIIRVLDDGEHDGVPFVVLEYLAGGSLRDRQRRDADGKPLPMPPAMLRDWLAPVASALDYIHGQGYVHRDVKPDNLLFDARGRPYLGDFGVAKVLAGQAQRTAQTVLTRAGVALGTAQYMAPELIVGKPFDGRADQYALAVTVYELLSGRYPFDDVNPSAILLQMLQSEPAPLEQLVPSVPPGLGEAVRRGLARTPDERWPSCTAFAGAVLQSLGPPTRKMDVPVGRPAPAPVPETETLLTRTSAQEHVPSVPGPLALAASVEEPRLRLSPRLISITAAVLAAALLLITTITWVQPFSRPFRLSPQNDDARQAVVSDAGPAEGVDPAAVPERISLEAVERVTICAGESQNVRVTVRREGYAGFVEVQCAGLPMGVRAAPLKLDADFYHGNLRLTVAPDAAEGTTPIQVTAVGGEHRVEASVLLHVRKPAVVLEAVPALQVKVNKPEKVLFTVRRQGCQQHAAQVTVHVDGGLAVNARLPIDVLVPRHEDVVQDEFLVELDPKRAGKGEVRVRVRLPGLSLEAEHVLRVQIDPNQPRLIAVPVQPLPAGGRRRVPIRVERDGYPGRLDLVVRGLPQGVRAENPWIEKGEDHAALRIVAQPDAPEGRSQFDVQARVDGRLIEPACSVTVAVQNSTVSSELPSGGLPLCLVFSPDGKQLLSVTEGGLKTWDLATGKDLPPAPRLGSGIKAATVSSNGKRLAAGSGSGIGVWDLQTGNRLALVLDVDETLKYIALSPNGDQMAAIAADRKLKIWDAHTGRHTLTLRVYDYPEVVNGLCFSPDGKRLAVSDPLRPTLWDLRTGRESVRLSLDHSSNTGSYAGLVFSSDGKYLAGLGGDANSILLWEAETGARMIANGQYCILRGHTHSPHAVSFSSDGKQLISAASDGVKVWELATCKVSVSLRGERGGTRLAAFHPDGMRFATAGLDGIKLWRRQSAQEVLSLAAPLEVSQLIYSRSGSHLLALGSKPVLKAWDAHTGEELASPREHGFPILPDRVGTRAKLQARVLPSGRIQFQDKHSGERPFAVRLALPDGKRFAMLGFDQAVTIWDSQTGKELFALAESTRSARDVALTCDGKQAAVAGSDGHVSLWDLDTRQQVRSLDGIMGAVQAVDCSDDGSTLAVTRADRVEVWNAQTGQKIRSFPMARGVACLSLSHDGKGIAVSDLGTELRVSYVASGNPVVLKGAFWGDAAVAFSPNGFRLVGVGGNEAGTPEVKVWQVSPGREPISFRGHTERIRAVAFAPNGKQIASAADDGTVRIWDLE